MRITGYDYLQFTSNEPVKISSLFQILGFRMSEVSQDGRHRLFTQGDVRFLLTKAEPKGTDHASVYWHKHGDGVCRIAFKVNVPPQEFLDHVVSKGAKVVAPLKTDSDGRTSRTSAAIVAFGDVWQSYEAHSGPVFAPGFQVVTPSDAMEQLDLGLMAVDHLTNNLDRGQLGQLSKFYQDVYGFQVTRKFDIRTGRTGLISEVIESHDHAVKIPINEATDELSQVQEFVVHHKGPGVQHIALSTPNIIETVTELRRRGVSFLDVPDTYYGKVPTRVKNVKEDMGQLKRNRILVDGNDKGYLLQIFSSTVIGPLFFEFIQRERDEGFGEGNFRALFEAIELDQQARGVFDKK